MAEMKRYDICAVIDENRNGEYVLYSDHLAALKAAVEKEREACASIALRMFHAAATGEEIADAIEARGTDHD